MKNVLFIWTVTVLMLASGCAAPSPSSRQQPEPAKKSNAYTTSFPTKDVSAELASIQQSVKRISSTGIFVTYFVGDKLITKDDLQTVNLEDVAGSKITNTESTAGTAISVFSNDRRIALLTNAHVISFPDTLISYLDLPDLQPDTFIRSVKIKKDQNNLIYDLPNVGSFEIIGMDTKADLALLKVNKNEFAPFEAPPLNIKVGNSRQLQWGSFVYVMGFPKGYPMVTRGIVSDPNRTGDGDFLTDALFNRGISGGLILASRDNFTSLEWVGMTNTATGSSSVYLVPDPTKADRFNSFEPYSESIYVDQKIQLNYGITQSIPIPKIRQFMESYSRELRRMGFRTNSLFTLPKN